ncbi:MAG: hypothetical protein AAF721_26310 [Myxococcota bacterium]
MPHRTLRRRRIAGEGRSFVLEGMSTSYAMSHAIIRVPVFNTGGDAADLGLLFPLLLFGIPVIVGAVFYVIHTRRAYETYPDDTPGREPAIGFEVSMSKLRADPDAMAKKLRPLAAAVSTFHSGNGRAISRLLDANSIEHPLEEGPTDDVEDNARWLADLLGVELMINV